MHWLGNGWRGRESRRYLAAISALTTIPRAFFPIDEMASAAGWPASSTGPRLAGLFMNRRDDCAEHFSHTVFSDRAKYQCVFPREENLACGK
jgi:hypothetical protein